MTNKHASALGKKGGPARAKSLSPERRREIAKQAADTRWKGQKTKQPPRN